MHIKGMKRQFIKEGVQIQELHAKSMRWKVK